MTVFVAHAPADREVAESLERYLERRGQFVELDDGQVALRPVAAADVLVLLASGRLLAAPERARLEHRALDAWAEEQLILVRLDETAPSVGFRDLPAVSRGEPDDWSAVAEGVQRALARAGKPPSPSRGRLAWLENAALALAALIGLGAAWVVTAIWLVNRIGPSPGGWPELREGLDAFAARFGIPFGAWIVLAAAAAGLAAAALLAARLVGLLFRKRAVLIIEVEGDAEQARPLANAAASARLRVLGLPAPRELGAASIGQALKQAERCVAACSPQAFEDDRFKRALHMADRYGKKLEAVYLSEVDPPPDFAHFLTGVRVTKLYEISEGERAEALRRVLGVAE